MPKLQPRTVTVRTYKGASMLTKNHEKRDQDAIARLAKGQSLATVSKATGISERHLGRMFSWKTV